MVQQNNAFYSVYLSDLGVELRSGKDSDFGKARFVCSQFNYENILEFALDLAKYKQLPFWDYSQSKQTEAVS
jgi:hypothetical protein